MVYPSSRIGRVVAVGILAGALCAGAKAQGFNAPQNVSNNNGDYSFTPQVAVDAAGNINLAWEDDTNNNSNILFRRSTDGGATFSAPKNLSNTTGFSSNPRLATDSHGAIYVVWEDDTPGNLEVFISKSTDGGVTFSAPQNLSHDRAGSVNPQLALDAAGNISVVWESNNIALGIFFTSSIDGGTTFSQPVNLASNLSGSFLPQMAVGSDGSIDVVWEDRDSTGHTFVSFSHASGPRAAFSTPQSLSTGSGSAFGGQIAVDASGNIAVVWLDVSPGNQDVFFSRSTDQGVTFSAAKNISNSAATSNNPQIATDASGNIFVAWEDSYPPATTPDIYFTRSSNGGGNFSVPLNISHGPGSSRVPWMTVDSASNVSVAWEETAPGKNNIFFTRSTDGGASFSASQNLLNDTGHSTEVQMAEDKNGNLNAVWSDDTSSVNQIFFDRFSNPKPANQPPVANAGADQVLEAAGPNGNLVTLDGSASSDPDGDTLTFLWRDENNNLVGASAVVQFTVGLGVHTYTLTVSDPGGLSSTAATHVTVRDTTPPTLQVSLSPSSIWPGNNRLVQVHATVVANDTVDPHPSVQLVSITSNDRDGSSGDIRAVGGRAVAFGTDVRTFLLRAERGSRSVPLVYTVTYMAKDASGNSTVVSAQVRVAPPLTAAPVASPLSPNQGNGHAKDTDRRDRDRRDRDRN